MYTIQSSGARAGPLLLPRADSQGTGTDMAKYLLTVDATGSGHPIAGGGPQQGVTYTLHAPFGNTLEQATKWLAVDESTDTFGTPPFAACFCFRLHVGQRARACLNC